MPTPLKSLLVITNLYPVPWAPNRASFNKQQFDLLAEHMDLNIIILLPWTEWLKQRNAWVKQENMRLCPYFYLPKVGRRLVPLFQYLSLLTMRSWIANRKPNAVLASWGFPDAIACARLVKKLNLPFFVKVHGTDVNENSQFPARRSLMRKWLSQAKQIFCASKALGKTLVDVGIAENKICVNYNGVNPDIFFPLEVKPSQKKLVFVGSLIPTKGVNELIDAFISLCKTDSEIELDIIGGGPLQDKLIKLADTTLKGRLHVHGSIPLNQVATFIRQANFLVLPSYREGVPNVLLESFASGTPVIATDVGGIPEVVTEETGIIIPAKNSKALEQAITLALSKTWPVEQILKHANNFNWHKNVTTVLKCLTDHE